MTIHEFLAGLDRVRRSGDGYVACCPSHEDRDPSLSVAEGADGRILVHCHAGCSTGEICAARSIEEAELFPEQQHDYAPQSPRKSVRLTVTEADVARFSDNLRGNTKAQERLAELRGWTGEATELLGLGLDGGRIVFPVRDSVGTLVSVERYAPNPEQRSVGPKMLAAPGSRRDLFPAPETVEVGAGWLLLLEGRSDPVRATSLGLPAVGVPSVSGWRREWAPRFAGLRVVVCFDSDGPGRKAAQRVAADLVGVAAEVRVLDLGPGREDGYDLSDFVEDARTEKERQQARELLLACVERAPVVKPDAVDAVSQSEVGLTASTASRPTMGEVAFRGLAGDVARVWAEVSEVDPGAVLVEALVAFGVLLGREPYVEVGPQTHRAAINALVIGPTATGRKGEGFAAVERVVKLVAEEWPSLVLAGLGSGEALIEAVRDPRHKTAQDGSETVEDLGVSDKRRLVLATEFARVLNVCRKDGNILGTVLREVWDGRPLQKATLSAPLKASGYHVAVIGQITPAEFRRLLDTTEAANGFLNRYLLVYSERPRLVAWPDQPDADTLGRIAKRLRTVLEEGRRLGEIKLASDARARWESVYADFTRDRGGLVGELCARHAPIAVRLALVYAILDGDDAIRREHLDAAFAICQYAEDTARYVFGDLTGDPLADRIDKAIRDRPGISREELRSTVLSRNRNASEVDRALDLLVQLGRITVSIEETGGRPATRYYPASERTSA